MSTYESLVGAARMVRSVATSIRPNYDPDYKTTITCSYNQNSIPLHIYDAPSLKSGSKTKTPIMVNWHGSGFVVPNLGKNGPYAHWLSSELDLTIIDADYAKGPELPFPNALHECVETIKWAVKQPYFDGRLALSGFSAGANLAVVLSNRKMAKQLGLTDEVLGRIKATVAFYPPVDMLCEKETIEELPANIPGAELSAKVMTIFNNCYMYGNPPTDPSHPMVSPVSADPADFVGSLLIISCTHDPLGPEAERFFQKLDAASPGQHRHIWAKEVGHGYENRIPELDEPDFSSSPGAAAKKETYKFVLDGLRNVGL